MGCQEGDFSHGIGSPYPFRLIRYKGKSAAQVKQALEHKNIAGLDFRILRTRTQRVPKSKASMCVFPTGMPCVRPN